MIPYWFEPNLLEEAKKLANKPISERNQKIVIYGSDGMMKDDLVKYIISQLPVGNVIIEHVDFNITSFNPTKIIGSFLQFHFKNNTDLFQLFLASFSEKHQKNILEKFTLLSQVSERKEWFQDIYFNFLMIISQKHTLNLIFENVDQLDGIQKTRLTEFISQIEHTPIRIIYTINPDGPFRLKFDSSHDLILSKLSIHTIEKCIQEYFKTTSINARLIANHCYLKTGGIALKTQMLLASVYRPLLKTGQNHHLNVEKMQKINLPTNWEDLFKSVYGHLSKPLQITTAILAYLAMPICDYDLKLILENQNLSTAELNEWMSSGILKKRIVYNTEYYNIRLPLFNRWVKNYITVEKIKSLLNIIYTFQTSGKFQGVYRLSNLFYDANDIDQAVRSATFEAEYFYEQSELSEAADRLYFLIRITDPNLQEKKNIWNNLERLGNIYLETGNYENAFEIYKKLRSIYTSGDMKLKETDLKQWITINLKMVQALISMDAYQEARYIIREIKVKDFCDLQKLGECYELIGDIEYNLGHVDNAMKNYQQAFEYYKNTGEYDKISNMYFKTKEAIIGDRKLYNNWINQIVNIFSHAEGFPELKGFLLKDKIQFLINDEKDRDALNLCYELWRITRIVYEPRLAVQLAFYFGEIYTLLGKWNLAISRLKRANEELYVIQHPSVHTKILIQLALIYKDQTLYGESRRLLEESMKLCFRFGYTTQIYEIKLHLGHIYLLVHSLIRSYEYLKEVYKWAEINKHLDLWLMSGMYLSYYELQREKFDNSRRLLSIAKRNVNLSLNTIDFLNYLFYLGMWLIERKRFNHAQKVIDLLIKKSKNLPRYLASGYYLLTRMNISTEGYPEGQASLKRGLKLSNKWHLPQIKYLLLCEQIRLNIVLYDENSVNLKKHLREVCQYIKNMAEQIGDEILKNQFLESNFHDHIYQLCKKYGLSMKKNGADQ